jgi:hypothetical protein
MNTTNLLGPMPVDAKAFVEGLDKVVAAGSAYPLGFSGKGLVMRLRMCATDECHDDEWLSAVMNQAADEIERLERENAELREALNLAFSIHQMSDRQLGDLIRNCRKIINSKP